MNIFKDDDNLTRWDKYFHQICKTVSTNSKCFSRQIGVVLVNDKRIISCGYNGPPSGIKPCDQRWFVDDVMRMEAGFDTEHLDQIYTEQLEGVCPRRILGYKSGEGLDLCVAGHAERNALINAARAGIQTKGCKLYMDCGIPCTPCLVEIINAGIEEIIVTKITYYDRSAEYVLKNSNLKYRVYNHLKDNGNDSKY